MKRLFCMSVERNTILLSAIGLIVLAAGPVGCRTDKLGDNTMIAMYREALERTEGALTDGVERGSESEKAAIARFIDFYKVYSTESIKAGVRDVYAEDAYFGDPFKGVEGIDEIETYFLRMAEPVEECTFEVEDVRESGGEYFIRWVMHLRVNRAEDHPLEALGFSHVRFDRDGKVVFQQDYWDTSGLFDRLPVVGVFTRWVKRRLEE